MAQFLARQIAERVLQENSANQYGREDPYFEQVPAARINEDKRSLKKGQKAKPPGVSDHDFKVLTKVKRRAHYLDSSFSLCGIRFGFSSVIGIIPLLGDCIDVFCALMVVRTCSKIEGGLPFALLFRMFLAICIDFGIGLVPVIGDVGDALYKANTHNAGRLEKFLREKGKSELRKSGLPIPATDPSDPQEFDRYQHGLLPHYNTASSSMQGRLSGPNRQNSLPQPELPKLSNKQTWSSQNPGGQKQPKRVGEGSGQETGIVNEPARAHASR